MEAVAMSNQGTADIPGNDAVVGEALRVAGYHVGHGRDLFGAVKMRAMSPAAYAAATARCSATTAALRESLNPAPARDYEAAIPARNDRHLFA